MYKDKNINQEKLQRYMEKLEDQDKKYVNKIIDNLKYIRTDELVEMVRRSVLEIK